MRLTVNGAAFEADVDARMPLAYLLRDVLGLKSVKVGCALEQCGACKVLVDGAPQYSCQRSAVEFEGAEVVTLEGFGTDALHPVQAAVLRHNAAQCGYCLAGILVAARALFDDNPRPSREQIQAALDPHLCRCGAHPRILRAFEELAGRG